MQESSPHIEQQLPLRPPAQVMDLKRLGSMHQSRLSFMRVLVRRMMAEKWQIRTSLMELDRHGYGTVVYTVTARHGVYSYVVFSEYLADDQRDDRVIAEKWDVTMTLCIGEVSNAQIAHMRRNVPKQEAGRADSSMLVLSRGNKSSRNFDYVVEQLSAGRQPTMQQLAKVGYLYRTTAVYGSGKFGMADWDKVIQQCPDFAAPFAAEMFSCYLLRQFSIEQAEYLAKLRSPATAVPMNDDVRRFIGIGNSTGLGMAPYLIRHPKLISQWVLTREKALARVISLGTISPSSLQRAAVLLNKARQHVAETEVPDIAQRDKNSVLQQELTATNLWLEKHSVDMRSWEPLVRHLEDHCSMETQEMFNSILLELYPELADDDAQYACVEEHYRLTPQMPLTQLRSIIEAHYGWALQFDFDDADANHYFWYRSEDKMEPRIGERYSEPGADKEMPLLIARLVRDCYDRLLADIEQHSAIQSTAYFLLRQPDLRWIVKRIQAMSQECYGEIRANLADKEMLPLDLLRCKLAFFGVSKFDPKSKLWVRNTMFQGAPVVSDIGCERVSPFLDDWCFPVTSDQHA